MTDEILQDGWIYRKKDILNIGKYSKKGEKKEMEELIFHRLSKNIERISRDCWCGLRKK